MFHPTWTSKKLATAAGAPSTANAHSTSLTAYLLTNAAAGRERRATAIDRGRATPRRAPIRFSNEYPNAPGHAAAAAAVSRSALTTRSFGPTLIDVEAEERRERQYHRPHLLAAPAAEALERQNWAAAS